MADFHARGWGLRVWQGEGMWDSMLCVSVKCILLSIGKTMYCIYYIVFMVMLSELYICGALYKIAFISNVQYTIYKYIYINIYIYIYT